MLSFIVRENDEERTIEVPDDKWVLETTSHTQNYYEEDGFPPETDFRRNAVVGPQPAAHTRTFEQWRSNGVSGCASTKLLVGDEPFGVVTTDTEGVGLRFTSARQAHKGQLGRRMPIKRPPIVRDATEFPHGNHSQRRKGQNGWVTLASLEEFAGMSACELVQAYFVFTSWLEPQLHLVQGDDKRVKSQMWHAFVCERVRAPELTPEYLMLLDLERTWVRVSWATHVLYMRALDYTPPQHHHLSITPVAA